jgi:5'-nucleotidase
MHILLTNDDGILAPGLSALQTALSKIGRVSVVAPASGQSAVGHAITLHGPIAVTKIRVHDAFEGHSVEGRPADCVKLAIGVLLDSPVDLVVSGINDGANAGINLLYSGTVAAAAEGAFLGIPSIAVSFDTGADVDFHRAADIAFELIAAILDHGLNKGQLINLNIPQLQPDTPRGVRVTHQAGQLMDDRFHRHPGPDGRDYYWLSGDFGPLNDGPESDLHALDQGYVTITPLHFDLTHRGQLDVMRSWSWPRQGND